MRLWIAWFVIIGCALAASFVGGIIGSWSGIEYLEHRKAQRDRERAARRPNMR